ncbi:MAG: hypothetical protein LBS42_08455 [Tannerella sp.]|jgi:hypothetical protein|nr:hypothetical protein [Tannerella sp.]
MAKQKNNVVTHGLSGTIGGQLVFRQTATGTVVQSPPRVSGKVSEAQRAQRRRFQRAILYAGVVELDPEVNADYASKAKKGQTARNVAVADFLHAPDIDVIDVSGYHGQPGDAIRIEVTDDFAVVEVKVVIANTDGTPVEEGYAKQEATGYEWTYAATVANASLEGDRIEVYASDTPGNITKAEETL